MVAYRHLGTTGSGSVPDTNGPVGLNTRFAFDMIDFDYNSRELSLWPQWDMKWTVGLRQMFLFYAHRVPSHSARRPPAAAFSSREQSNNIYGLGPHAALELNRRLGDSGWSLYCRVDVGAVFGYVWEGWLTVSTTLGANGRPLAGQTHGFGHQVLPMINCRAGLNWKPSPASGTRLFVGYQYDVIWDLNRLPQSNGTPYAPPSLGQFWSQGIVLQATFKW